MKIFFLKVCCLVFMLVFVHICKLSLKAFRHTFFYSAFSTVFNLPLLARRAA